MDSGDLVISFDVTRIGIYWIYIYIYARPPPPPRSTFCILLSAQSSTRKLFAQLKRKTKNTKKQETTKKNQKTKKPKNQTHKKKQKKQNPEGNVSARVSSESLFFLFFFVFFVFFGFSVCSVYGCFGHILEKDTFHYRPLVFTISLRKRLFPKYFRQFILNFFL